ncbi:MAG: hypothetical protein OHK0029_25040 [Armatimonadaceae bacterium]
MFRNLGTWIGVATGAVVCAACLPETNAGSTVVAVKAAETVSAAAPGPGQQKNNSGGYVWFEAENPARTNFPAQNPFAPANEQEAEVLSEGKWIGTASDRSAPLYLEYEVSVPSEGNYQFYARKFWKHGPFRWRFDNQPWQEVGREVALLDSAELRLHTVANWVSVGSVKLDKGKHTLRIEATDNKGAIAFDAFLLTRQPFVARGKMKPGEKYNRAPAGWFSFEPDPDPFAPSPIDLRYLNEKYAGENGFIVARGESFVHGNSGKPVRFWAINTGMETVYLDRAAVDYFARSLAKQGVNIVRLHGGMWKDNNFREIDPEKLDRVHYFVSALKREGIYTCLSIYFPLWLDLKDADGFAGYDQAKSKHPFALLFFNEDFQKIYRGWWQKILTTPNPYAENKPLREDPALAMAEIINEDSYLFWTFTPYENIPAPQMAILEKQFGDWAAKKYGSLDRAFATWGGNTYRGDDKSAGRVGFMPLWEMFNKKDARGQDTAVFLAESQKKFFEETYRYLKQDLGYKASVYASNWITANGQILGPLDKWSNTVADFMDRHGYFGGRHEGERASYSVSKGDRYSDRSALLFSSDKPGGEPDFSLPIWDIQYNKKPSIISEVNWPNPNRFRADLPFVAATYGVLQGSDGIFFFATGSPSWEQGIGKFSIRTPVVMGQFPATALLFRQGLIETADPVVSVNLPVADIKALKGAPVSAPLNLDELRAKDIPAGQTVSVAKVGSIDPLAPLVGKVAMEFTAIGGTSQIADLSKYINRQEQTVRSETGELSWNWGDGRVALMAEKASGVTGFLSSAGKMTLKDMVVDSPLEYGSILLVTLDGKPIAQSQKLLLQVMSEDAPYGWKTGSTDQQGLKTITDIGGAPIVVKNIAGTVSLRRPDASSLRVTALDLNGYPTDKMGNAQSINLRPNTLYYLIEK